MSMADRLKPLAQLAAPLLLRLRTLQRSFNGRQARERVLMIAVGMALVLAIADKLLIDPAYKTLQAAHRQSSQALRQREALRTDALRLGNAASTQDQLRRAELVAWRQRVREGEALLRSHEDALIGPDQMLGLLEQVLARHGQVRVRSMRSLDRVDLLAQTPPAAPAGGTGGAGGTAVRSPAATQGANLGVHGATSAADSGAQSLYRHGVELVLEGGFNDLLGYVQALEAMPQHVLWGGMSLKVQQHPNTVLTLRLYTISRDRNWLEI